MCDRSTVLSSLAGEVWHSTACLDAPSRLLPVKFCSVSTGGEPVNMLCDRLRNCSVVIAARDSGTWLLSRLLDRSRCMSAVSLVMDEGIVPSMLEPDKDSDTTVTFAVFTSTQDTPAQLHATDIVSQEESLVSTSTRSARGGNVDGDGVADGDADSEFDSDADSEADSKTGSNAGSRSTNSERVAVRVASTTVRDGDGDSDADAEGESR